MRIFILTLGTRGDLELFLTLARTLRDRGHQILLATSPFYGPQVQEAGLDWTAVGIGTYEEQLAALRALTAIPDRLERVREYSRHWLLPQLRASFPLLQSLAERADYFINNLKIMLKQPGSPDVIPGAWVMYDPPISEENRKAYDSQQPEDGSILNLVALNKQLVDPQDQWGERYHFTGFWTADRAPAAEPSADLAAFLQAGPPPVVLTMGSMVMFDPQQLARTFTEALRRSGQRGVIVGGWSGISRTALPSPAAPAAPASLVAGWWAPPPPVPFAGSVLCVDEAPYDWLFPRAACVLHHGGCGTLAAVLRAGIPSILLPQIPPQEIFGRLLQQAHLATGSLDVCALDPAALADAIQRAVTDETVRQSCRTWQTLVAEDKGVPEAADLIEHHAQTLPPRPVVKGRWGRARTRGGW